VVAGPNGSGKSSLLKAIYKCPDCRRHYDEKGKCHYFNSETMNPHRFGAKFRGLTGSIIRVRAMFSSHGETMRDVLRYFEFKPGDCFLLDEPESGHDLQWVIKIYKGLRQISRQGCQVIVASHHPVFWQDGNLIELKSGYLETAVGIYKKYWDCLKAKCK